uniref:NADH-ubiquinone oxidoreductase chain 6 n=1 Tax=Megacyllene sp. KM-2017 TaxID=2219442 RepID=A0A346RJ51_9CUCU|nr:NADH dehydrogenase subunit 6 [Megacyllene sp. KM-2017]
MSLSIMSLTLSIAFLFLMHPLSFGLILLLQTLCISLMTGMMNYNFWFSYILFLIMVGGMLILFIYMTSVASNESFKLSMKMALLFLFSLMLTTSTLFMDKIYQNMNVINHELVKFSPNNMSLTKYLNMPNNFVLTMVIIYLLITLIMIVKIVNNEKGPLRQMF